MNALNNTQAGKLPDSQAVLDVQAALERMGGRMPLFERALNKFVPEYGKAYDTIARQLANRDKEAASRTAHSVKSAAATIGAISLSQISATLEKALSDEGADIDALLRIFKRELEQTLKAIVRF